MSKGLAYASSVLLALCLTGCEKQRSLGASTPSALLEKLVDGLDSYDAEMVRSCFDLSTTVGQLAGSLTFKAMNILRQTRQFEQEVRDRFSEGAGERYIEEFVAMPGPALFFEQLRHQIKTLPLSVSGNTAYLGTNASTRTLMYRETSGLQRWFLSIPAPFLQDAEALKQVNLLLDLFDEHCKAALATVRPARDAKKFRTQMAVLGQQTQKKCKPVAQKMMTRFRELGLVWK